MHPKSGHARSRAVARASSHPVRLVCSTVLLLALALAAVAAGAAPVRIAVSLTPLSTPFFVAQQRELFAAAGVEVEIVDTYGGHRALQQVLDGQVMLATTSETPIMYRSFERDDFAVLTTFVTSGNDVKLVARQPLRRPADLVGRRIGTVKGASSQYFLDTFLLVHGVDPASVEVVGLQPENAVASLVGAAVDAIAIWEPYAWLALRQLGDAAVQLEGPEIYTETFNLVALRDTAAANQREVAAVLHALREAIAFIHQHPAAAQAITRERLGLEQDFVDWIWPDFQFGLSLSQSLVVTLEGEARWAMHAGHLRTDGEHVDRALPDFPLYFMPAPLEQVQPRAVSLVH